MKEKKIAIQFRLTGRDIKKLDDLVKKGNFINRAEAIRFAVNKNLAQYGLLV